MEHLHKSQTKMFNIQILHLNLHLVYTQSYAFSFLHMYGFPSFQSLSHGHSLTIKYSTSLVSSGSVWSTVSDKSFCRYFSALNGSDWAFSSNLAKQNTMKVNMLQIQQRDTRWQQTQSRYNPTAQ